jgi:hypothetical protein
MSINFRPTSHSSPISEQTVPLFRSKRSSEDGPSLIVDIPAGASVIARREANNSTTLEFTWANGVKESWNSGQAITCQMLSTGFAIGGAIGGPATSRLLGLLAAAGCSYAFNYASQDGDS